MTNLKAWMNKLTPRIQKRSTGAYTPTPEQKRFAMFVRTVRVQLGKSRYDLAMQTGLDQDWLGFLEHNLVTEDEITPAVKAKLEQVLGATFLVFGQIHDLQHMIDEYEAEIAAFDPNDNEEEDEDDD